jgi:hypothetical protein
MSARKRRIFRIAVVSVWLLWALIVVGAAFAQDGNNPDASGAPNSLDSAAARLAPLLVGAALIERTLEFLFNWVERAILDAGAYLHNLATRLTGLVDMDLRPAWERINVLTSAMLERKTAGLSANVGDAKSDNPADWPLAKLRAQIAQADQMLVQAEKAIDTALKSPQYIARKKTSASVLSIVFGVLLALSTSMRLFEPIGIQAPENFEGAFSKIDLVLAGILMGLGTEWVHQVINLVIKGQGLLGRAASGKDQPSALLNDEQLKRMLDEAVQRELTAQLARLREQAEGAVTDLIQPDKPEGDSPA